MSLKAQDVYAMLNSKIEEGGSGGGTGTINYNNLKEFNQKVIIFQVILKFLM